ncbi:hypothetical protein LINPERHAP1_LOCUS4145 [Linum perenne]
MVDKGKAIVFVRDTSPPTPSRTPIQPIRSTSRTGRRSRFFSEQDEPISVKRNKIASHVISSTTVHHDGSYTTQTTQPIRINTPEFTKPNFHVESQCDIHPATTRTHMEPQNASNNYVPRRTNTHQSRVDHRSRLFSLLGEIEPDKDITSFCVETLDPTTSNANATRSTTRPLHVDILDLGLPTLECKYCGAFFWHQEALHRAGRKTNPAYSLCCQDGKVELPLLQQTPALLDSLLSQDGNELSRHYQKHIRSYNAAFSWTSFGAKFSQHILNSRGPYSLVLCGENYHFMGSILPVDGERPRYSQLYVFDPASEVDDRLSNVSSSTRTLNAQLMSDLKDMLDEYNVLTQSFRRVRDALQLPENENLRLRISGTRVQNDRRYELPTGTDLAGLIPGDFEPDHGDRDIIVSNKSTGLTRITSLNPLFDSLHFPLLFPYGNDGYHEMIRYNPLYVDPNRKRGFVSQNEYYNFRLQYRRVEGKTLIRSGKALQHFCIDAFTTIEQNRLIYLRLNQKKLRADLYNGLQDALNRGDLNSQNLGNIILPATFTGGVRYMMQLYQDAISICQFHGNPDLFITFTCNAQWPELVNAFKDIVGSRSEDKPMLVARVFKMRLSLLREDLKKKQYFGRYVAG